MLTLDFKPFICATSPILTFDYQKASGKANIYNIVSATAKGLSYSVLQCTFFYVHHTYTCRRGGFDLFI